MTDVIFIAATIVFFAVCALYVQWCDKIIGPDNFNVDVAGAPLDDEAQALVTAVAGPSSSEVPS